MSIRKRNISIAFWPIIVITLISVVPKHDCVHIKDINWCASPFCKVKINHTICKWGLACEPDRRCETNLEFGKDVKDYVMELHNQIRSKIALGNEPKVPEHARKAADMSVMQWDIHLEFVARCHSRQCEKRHDECRSVPRFPYVGQNIYSQNFTYEENENIDARNIVDRALETWYGEIENVTEEVYSEWQKTEKISEEFTQIVWAKTTHMGCGLSEKKFLKSIRYFLVCNYGNEGNVKGQPIYTVGEPCSKCIWGKHCNSVYPGLCGIITEYPLRCPCEEETVMETHSPMEEKFAEKNKQEEHVENGEDENQTEEGEEKSTEYAANSEDDKEEKNAEETNEP